MADLKTHAIECSHAKGATYERLIQAESPSPLVHPAWPDWRIDTASLWYRTHRPEQALGGRHPSGAILDGMATLVEQVTHDIAGAMKSKDQVSLGPLRMLKAALVNKEVEKGRALDASESVQVVSSLVKQRRDASEQFRAGHRDDLADKEQAEIAFLQRYLPPAADAQAVAAAIEAAVQDTGATGPKDMGKVMKAVTARLAGLTVDGRSLSEAVKKRLAG
jgi:uncharacterized protein YqeY